jgi:transcriptional regulator with XRE-family HTH domain
MPMTPVLKQQAFGEHVRHLRTQAAMSLRTLARQTDFSPSFISQLERGEVSPSIGSMEKIAAALGVSLSQFFAAAAEGEGGKIVRAGEREALSSGWSQAEIQALSLPGPTARLEAILVTLRPGGRSGKHPYGDAREEFAFVLRGTVILTLGVEEHRLRRGDSVAILPGELRLWRNQGRAPAEVMIIAVRVAGGSTAPRGGSASARASR